MTTGTGTIHVLVIDDDRWFVEQYQRVFKKAGYVVSIAYNAVEGIACIDRVKPDVIVLDLFMPGPNGLVFLQEIQTHSDLSSIPIILSTNSATDIKNSSLHAYGIRGVLDKTVMHPEDVVAAVKRVLK